MEDQGSRWSGDVSTADSPHGLYLLRELSAAWRKACLAAGVSRRSSFSVRFVRCAIAKYYHNSPDNVTTKIRTETSMPPPLVRE